ncbi:MAG: hypothetical protein EXS35_05120 [Pedosphaera sp.]|nr:hypothetical protein [Pedosphaera sp.]
MNRRLHFASGDSQREDFSIERGGDFVRAGLGGPGVFLAEQFFSVKIPATMSKTLLLAGVTAVLCVGGSPLFAQGTAFTYQGRLLDGTNPAGGTYDFRFNLYDTSAGATPRASSVTSRSRTTSTKSGCARSAARIPAATSCSC